MVAGALPHNVSSPHDCQQRPSNTLQVGVPSSLSVDEETHLLTGWNSNLELSGHKANTVPSPLLSLGESPWGGNVVCEVGRAELEALKRPVAGERRAGDPRRDREMSKASADREVGLDKDWQQQGWRCAGG